MEPDQSTNPWSHPRQHRHDLESSTTTLYDNVRHDPHFSPMGLYSTKNHLQLRVKEGSDYGHPSAQDPHVSLGAILPGGGLVAAAAPSTTGTTIAPKEHPQINGLDRLLQQQREEYPYQHMHLTQTHELDSERARIAQEDESVEGVKDADSCLHHTSFFSSKPSVIATALADTHSHLYSHSRTWSYDDTVTNNSELGDGDGDGDDHVNTMRYSAATLVADPVARSFLAMLADNGIDRDREQDPDHGSSHDSERLKWTAGDASSEVGTTASEEGKVLEHLFHQLQAEVADTKATVVDLETRLNAAETSNKHIVEELKILLADAEGTLVGSEDSDTESLFFGSRLDQIKDGFSLALTGDSASSSSIPSMSAPFGSTAAISAAVSAVASGDDAVYNRICNALQGLIAEAQTALLRGTSSTLLPHQQPQSQHSQSQQAGPSVYSKRQTCTHYTDATGEGRGSLCTTSRQDSFIEVLATSPTALSESEADPTTRSRASSVTSSIHSSFSGSITSLAHSTRPVPLSRATLQVPSTGALGAAATTAGRMSPMSRSMSASSRKEFSKILWKEKQQEQYERYRRSCDQVSLELETLLNNAMKMSNEDNDEDSDRGSNYYHNYFSRWSDENRSQGSAHEAHELEYDPVNDAKKSTKSEAQAISLSESESMVGDMNKPFTMDYHKESIEAESDISAAESSYQSARLLAASLKSSALSLPSRLLSSRVNSPLPTSDADVEASLSPVVQDGSIVEETTKSKVLFMHRQYQMQLMQEGGIAGTQHRQRQCAYDTEDEDSGLELLDENRAESSSLSSWGSRSGPLVDSGPFYDHRYQLFDPSKHQRHSLEVHAKQSTRQPRHRHQSQHASEQNVDSHLPQRRQVRNQGVGASRSNSLLMQLYGLWTQTWLRRRIMHVLAGTIEFSVAALIVLKASESILSWAGVSTPGGGIQDWLHSLVSGSIRHTTSSAASAAAKTGSVAGTGGAGFARELYEKILKDGMIIKKANGGGEHHPRGPGVASLLRSALITATTVAATSPSSASTTAQLGLETAQQQAATRTPFTATAMVLAPTVRIVTQILVGFLVAHIVDQVRRLRKKF